VDDNAQDPATRRGLALVAQYGAAENWLAVLVTAAAAAQPSVSVVNAGLIARPGGSGPVVAFVSRSPTAKLRNLRVNRTATLVFRSGWEWIAVEGPVALAGPDDPYPGLDGEGLRRLLRDIYVAAGGNHSDPAEYDRVMAAERRTAVLLTPRRFIGNPPGTEHKEHS
jgi:hypothetical protein